LYLSKCLNNGSLYSLEEKNQYIEVECNMLRNMVVNLNKDMHSTTSTKKKIVNSSHANLKEEEIVHQLKDEMDIGH
jgi:hypothetical protein